MAIPISSYVSDTASVGGAGGVPTRNLGGRFFTENPLVPTGTFVQFTNANDVGTYFGTTSVEYLRAVFYFGFISKTNNIPDLISFANWANVATASLIFGAPGAYAISQFTGITTGDFTLTMGGLTHHLTSINLSAVGSLAAVATDIQTAVNAFSGGGTAWISATVTYDATRGCFDLTSGLTGIDTISVIAGSSEDLIAPLGWGAGAIFSNGSAAQTITQVLTNSAAASNNFGSFAFIPTLDLAQVTEAATWNDAQNVMFMYSAPVSVANASAWSAALSAIGGTTLTLAPLSNEYPEQAPMMVLAATDYTGTNTVQNYMFQTFNLTASVTDLTDETTYNNLSINYYGQTQQAGQLVSFYQTGVMFGVETDPLDQNTYANEIWLKGDITSTILGLLIALSQLPANKAGTAQLTATLQNVVNQAVTNGTISVGKALNSTQIAFITNATNSNTAWQQVQNIGYWLNTSIQTYIVSGVTKYKAVYLLIYSKDDVIRFVQGQDILI
jgi:Protein of unknown function (DUF3383)